MQTLKLEANVTQKTEIEIPVPFFARTKDERHYIGLLDEKTVVKFYCGKEYSSLSNATVDTTEKRDLIEAYNTWLSCTESEFLDKYDALIESISLHPKIAV